MASAVATPLEKQFSTIAGLDSMTSTSALGSTRSRCSSTSSRNIDAAAQDVQATIAQRRAPAAAADADAAVVPEGQSRRTSRSCSWSLQLADAAAVDGRRVRARRSSPSASRRSAASRRCRSSARRSTRCASTSTRASSPARGIGIDEVAHARFSNANVNLPTGTLYGADAGVHRPGRRPAAASAAAYGPLIVAYRNGKPVRLDELAHVFDGVENDKTGELVSAASATSTWSIQQAAGHQHRRGRRRDQGSCCRRFRAAAAGRRCTLDVRTRPLGVDPRVGRTTCKFTLLLTLAPGRRW